MGSVTIKDFEETLNRLLGLFTDWLSAALHPIGKCQSLLSAPTEEGRLRESMSLWAVSFVISVAVFFPLYHPYGIGLASLEFHLSVILYLTLGLIASGFAIQFGLKIYGIRAPFSEVVAIYTAFVMCYQPLVNLLCYFGYLRFFALLGSAKAQGLDLGQTIGFFKSQAVILARRQDLAYIASKISSWLLLAGSCLSSSFMVSTVAERYSVPKVKSFSAFAFAMTILLPPIALIEGLLVAYTEYVFISVGGTSALTH